MGLLPNALILYNEWYYTSFWVRCVRYDIEAIPFNGYCVKTEGKFLPGLILLIFGSVLSFIPVLVAIYAASEFAMTLGKFKNSSAIPQFK